MILTLIINLRSVTDIFNKNSTNLIYRQDKKYPFVEHLQSESEPLKRLRNSNCDRDGSVHTMTLFQEDLKKC